MQPYFDPTRKKTSEEKNGRRPRQNEYKWKTASKKMKMEGYLNIFLNTRMIASKKMEDKLKKKKKGRRPKTKKRKTTSKYFFLNDLIFFA